MGELHIAYITSEFVTEKRRGGLATYLSNITAIMSKYGHKVTVITLSEQTGKIQYNDKIEVIRVQAEVVKSTKEMFNHERNLLFNSWKLYQVLKQEHKRNKIDIVQAANFKAVGFFRIYSIPTVVRVSSDAAMLRNANEYEFDYKKAFSKMTCEDFLELWCVKRADAVFAPSRFCASVVGTKAKRKIAVIESPYFDEKTTIDESIYQERLFNRKYLLFNSSLSRLKGTHIGIEAAESLMEKYPDLYMVYVGYDYGLNQKDGRVQKVANILKRQSRKYEGRVIYLGHLCHERLFPVIKNSFACVLPSRVDNLPNSCIEAMALGCVVIGTYGASFEQLIENKQNGLLIERDSSNALIKAVDYLMAMKNDELSSMRNKAVCTIERLNPKRVYDEMIDFYRRIIKEYK